MNATLEDYINTGRIGDLQLGLTKQEIADSVGVPPNWAGKTESFSHSLCPLWENADVWKYYEDAVGVRFNRHGIAVGTIVYPEFGDAAKEPFFKWPFQQWPPKMSDFRNYLTQREIPFRESFLDAEEDADYYIVAFGYCLAFCHRYDEHGDGPMQPGERRISMFSRFLNKEEFPLFVTDNGGIA